MNDRGAEDVLILWDCPEEPVNSGVVWTWNGHDETTGKRSLLRYVEVHGERLRARYVAWVHDLGETQLGGERLVDRLSLGNGFSYWWMTLFVEQSIWKQPSITDAFRLFALEEIVRDERATRVRLVSADERLHQVARSFCDDLGLAFERRQVRAPRSSGSFAARLYGALPPALKGVLSFARYMRERWPLRRVERGGWIGESGAWFLCSYFIHLDAPSCQGGHYYCRLWEELPALMRERGLHTNWLHHYLKSNTVPDTATAVDWLWRFNEKRAKEGFHTFVDSYATWGTVFRVFMGWLRLNL